jgi:hypothetical protein
MRNKIKRILVRGRVHCNNVYMRTSISGTKKAQITFPLRIFFPVKVVKYHGKVKSNSMENCPA